MGNAELAPEVDVSTLEPLLSPDVVSELLDTYMSTLTVSRCCGPEPGCVPQVDDDVGSLGHAAVTEASGQEKAGERPVLMLASSGCAGSVSEKLGLEVHVAG